MTDAVQKPVAVRMSQDTKAYLEARAKEGFRTLNREILLRLEESRKRDEATKTAGAHA